MSADVIDSAMRLCVICTRPLPPRKQRLCSPECAAESKRQQAKATYDADPAAQRARVRASRNPERARAVHLAWEARQPTAPCEVCGTDSGKRAQPDRRATCSNMCRTFLRYGRWPQCKVRQRKPRTWAPTAVQLAQIEESKSPLRRALEACDVAAIERALQPSVEISGDCWLWQRRIDSNGYAVLNIGSKRSGLHRLIAAAVHGPLGSQPVHHTCANRRCVRPLHLQPVTHRENVAEMLQRRYYLHRIAELEDALATLSPHHPALAASA